MASTEISPEDSTIEFSLEEAKESLQKNGFFFIQDSAVGDRVQEMEERDFPIVTVYGLRFCKLYVLGDKRIRDTVESLFGQSYLGMYLRFGYHPGYQHRAYRFQMGGETAGLGVLIVQLWAKNSRATYYKGSHVLDLATTDMPNAMYATADADIQEAGLNDEETPFKDGGLAFFDARTLFKIKNKSALTFAFTTKDVLEAKEWPWDKMLLPNSEGMAEEVTEMESISPKIGVNFAFRKDES